MEQGTPEAIARSIDYLERVIEREPGFAPAHAALARAHIYRWLAAYAEPGEMFTLAGEHAERALALDEGLADAHAARAQILFFYDWDWEAAERAFETALALDPNAIVPRMFYSDFLVHTSRAEEGVAVVREALRLDPLSPFMRGPPRVAAPRGATVRGVPRRARGAPRPRPQLLARLRDPGALESALARPVQRWSHEEDADLAAPAAAYCFGIARNHPFVDGNKRMAFLSAYVFLGLNGWDVEVEEAELVLVILEAAAGERDENDLAQWFRGGMVSR